MHKRWTITASGDNETITVRHVVMEHTDDSKADALTRAMQKAGEAANRPLA